MVRHKKIKTKKVRQETKGKRGLMAYDPLEDKNLGHAEKVKIILEWSFSINPIKRSKVLKALDELSKEDLEALEKTDKAFLRRLIAASLIYSDANVRERGYKLIEKSDKGRAYFYNLVANATKDEKAYELAVSIAKKEIEDNPEFLDELKSKIEKYSESKAIEKSSILSAIVNEISGERFDEMEPEELVDAFKDGELDKERFIAVVEGKDNIGEYIAALEKGGVEDLYWNLYLRNLDEEEKAQLSFRVVSSLSEFKKNAIFKEELKEVLSHSDDKVLINIGKIIGVHAEEKKTPRKRGRPPKREKVAKEKVIKKEKIEEEKESLEKKEIVEKEEVKEEKDTVERKEVREEKEGISESKEVKEGTLSLKKDKSVEEERIAKESKDEKIEESAGPLIEEVDEMIKDTMKFMKSVMGNKYKRLSGKEKQELMKIVYKVGKALHETPEGRESMLSTAAESVPLDSDFSSLEGALDRILATIEVSSKLNNTEFEDEINRFFINYPHLLIVYEDKEFEDVFKEHGVSLDFEKIGKRFKVNSEEEISIPHIVKGCIDILKTENANPSLRRKAIEKIIKIAAQRKRHVGKTSLPWESKSTTKLVGARYILASIINDLTDNEKKKFLEEIKSFYPPSLALTGEKSIEEDLLFKAVLTEKKVLVPRKKKTSITIVSDGRRYIVPITEIMSGVLVNKTKRDVLREFFRNVVGMYVAESRDELIKYEGKAANYVAGLINMIGITTHKGQRSKNNFKCKKGILEDIVQLQRPIKIIKNILLGNADKGILYYEKAKQDLVEITEEYKNHAKMWKLLTHLIEKSTNMIKESHSKAGYLEYEQVVNILAVGIYTHALAEAVKKNNLAREVKAFIDAVIDYSLKTGWKEDFQEAIAPRKENGEVGYVMEKLIPRIEKDDALRENTLKIVDYIREKFKGQ